MTHHVWYKWIETHWLTVIAVACIALGYVSIATSWSLLAGVLLLGGGLVSILMAKNGDTRRSLGLIWIGVAILSITPIGTATNIDHVLLMTPGMAAAVAVPYVLSRRQFKHSLIHLEVHFAHRWTWREIGYVVACVTTTTFCMYQYFTTTSAHSGWPLTNSYDIVVVFVSIMLIGIWEEFFFIAFIFGLLQRIMPAMLANAIQASMFCAFLYQIGFQGWIVPLTFAYALYQGYIFHLTRNLLITLTIHVLVDLIVFLVLLYAARPDLFH